MGVDLNDDAYKQQAALITRGLSTESDFQNFIRQQAQSQYPAFSSQIDAGQTMKQIANPYVQTMAQSLEMNPNNISLKDPTITSALNGLDANGKPVGKTITSFQQQLRGDPRWSSTQQAQDQAMSISKQVLNQMGLMG
jgi:succinyl-CoA synthetase beta subunit